MPELIKSIKIFSYNMINRVILIEEIGCLVSLDFEKLKKWYVF